MDVSELAREWLRLDQDPKTRKQIQDLLSENDVQSLRSRLEARIAFGTAGLRARAEAGFARMNCLTVIQTSQGLAQYLLDSRSGVAQAGVVIGYDARTDSLRFANVAAAAFKAKGFRIHWYEDIVHTPLVPFAVKTLKAAAGIMVTASHNPKEDNGYKVYGSNGCQINSPEDRAIAEAILQNLEPMTWDTTGFSGTEGILRSMTEQYYTKLSQYVVPGSSKLPHFVYTPMHGVGLRYMAGAMEHVFAPLSQHKDSEHRSSMIPVDAQSLPDAQFPTVKYPNPEEQGALDLAKATADEHGVSLVLANDPDADRFAAAERLEGVWHQFKGDELGVLLGHHIYKRTAGDNRRVRMLTSAVSSQMLAAISEDEGFVVEETLTGFKWLGNRALSLGDQAVFGYEEALGYMLPDLVHDKDGISAAMLFLEACSSWSGSPYRHLQSLYKKYGYFETMNTYWKSPNFALTAQIFETIRARSTMDELLNAPTRVRDMAAGTDTGTVNGKAALPISPDNQMITAWHHGNAVFRDGVRYTIRASGTEPKIKGKTTHPVFRHPFGPQVTLT